MVGVTSCTIALSLCVMFIYLAVKIRKYYLHVCKVIEILDQLPHLPRRGWLGHIPLIKEYTWTGFIEKNHEAFVSKGEKVYVLWMTVLNPVVITTHPDTAKQIMRSTEPKGNLLISGYTYLRPWLGKSLLLEDGKRWERNRHLLTPAFHFGILENYVTIDNQVADILLDKLGDSVGTPVDVVMPMKLAALDTLLQCVLSYKGNVQKLGTDHPYVTAVEKLADGVMKRGLKLIQIPLFTYKLTAAGREFFQLTKYVHNFSAGIIHSRRKELTDNPDELKKRFPDFLDILLTAKDEDGQGLTDEEIRCEVDTFMFAGHDTTGTVLSYFTYALGQHPDHQEALYTELQNVLDSRSIPEWEHIPKMKKLSAFLKEVMRLYTPVPMCSRVLTQPYELLPGVTVPKGITINLNMNDIHHNPVVWNDPDEFHPERFETDNLYERDPYSFVPFSAGPRNCIGQHFALNEVKIIMARIINRFQVLAVPNHKLVTHYGALLESATGIKVILRNR